MNQRLVTHYVLTTDNMNRLVELLRQAPFYLAQPCLAIVDQSQPYAQSAPPTDPGKIVNAPVANQADAEVAS